MEMQPLQVATSSDRRGRVLRRIVGMPLLVLIGLGVALSGYTILVKYPMPWLPTTRPSIWWEATFYESSGQPTPMLSLSRQPDGTMQGSLMLPFEKGYNAVLSIRNGSHNQQMVHFTTEDPQAIGIGYRPTANYVLKKTGPKTAVLFRLRAVTHRNWPERLQPTDLETTHQKIATLTTTQSAAVSANTQENQEKNHE